MSNTKSLYFSTLPAALRVTSNEVGKCARKVNPLLDQSELFIKKTFPALIPGRVKYVPMGNKKLRGGFETF